MRHPFVIPTPSMKLPSTYRLHAAAAALAALIAWSVPTLPLRAEDPAPAPAAPAETPAAVEQPAAPAEAPVAAEPTPAVEAPAAPSPAVEAAAPVATPAPSEMSDEPREHRARELVTVRAHAHLRAGETVPEMVTIMGNAIVDGVVDGECVTVMGNVTVNGKVRGELVCVGGTITLGPGAVIHGEVVSVGGAMVVDPSARIHGDKVAITLPGLGGWVAEWFQDGLGQARVLPHNHAWAWGTAVFLVFLNLLFATVFRGAVTASARAVETRPVFAFVNGALVLLLLPVLLVLLAASVVGIPLLPVAICGLFLAWFIGTIGIFCFCGQQFGLTDRPVLAVLVGNLIFVLLYALPIVGFAVWSVTGLMGLGAAITAMGNRRREAREARDAARREEQARRAQATPPPAVTPQVQVTPTTPVYMAPPAPMAAAVQPETTSMGFVGTPPPMAAAASASPAPASTTFVPPYSGWTPPPQPPPAIPPVGVTVPPLPSDELNERATFWPRLVAVVLDMLAVTVAVNMLGLGSFPMWVLSMLAYHTFFWGWRGTTPGGIVMNLQVVRDDRSPMDYKVAGVRALSGVFSMVPGGLGLIWVAFDRDNQSWHDKLAGTSVIVVRKAKPLI
jgi:uncharacterized RDD family membrane protein YckC